MNNAKVASAVFRENRKNRERSNRFALGSAFAQITGISGFSEQARVFGFPTKITIQHPFLSANAWIRGLPEIGTPIMAQFNHESDEAIHIGYRQINPEQALKEAAEGNSLYQELFPGEIDILSSGMSHTFKGTRPIDVREAGLVRSILDGDTSSSINKAVTFIDILHQNEPATIKDTRRFGVVRRPTNSVETKIVKAPDESDSGLTKKQFAKECSTILVNKEGYLLDYREGNVVEDDGTHPISSWTGKYLRLRKQIFNVSQETTKIEIDNQGNIDITVPDKAESGIRLNVATGSIEARIGNEISIISTNNFLIKATGDSTLNEQCGVFIQEISKDGSVKVKGNYNINASKSIDVSADGSINCFSKTGSVYIGGLTTNLGQENQAIHPLVLGDMLLQTLTQLLTALSAHVHLSTGAPSVDLAAACTAIATQLPTLVSKNVKTQ